MIIALCVDDRMGLSFNNRRLSKDAALRQRLLALSSGPLRMSPATARQFDSGDRILPGENYLADAGPGEWCFCENRDYLNHRENIESIVLFRWNRAYPSDTRFEFPGQWQLASSEDFPGTSHPQITQEVYIP